MPNFFSLGLMILTDYKIFIYIRIRILKTVHFFLNEKIIREIYYITLIITIFYTHIVTLLLYDIIKLVFSLQYIS